MKIIVWRGLVSHYLMKIVFFSPDFDDDGDESIEDGPRAPADHGVHRNIDLIDLQVTFPVGAGLLNCLYTIFY